MRKLLMSLLMAGSLIAAGVGPAVFPRPRPPAMPAAPIAAVPTTCRRLIAFLSSSLPIFVSLWLSS